MSMILKLSFDTSFWREGVEGKYGAQIIQFNFFLQSIINLIECVFIRVMNRWKSGGWEAIEK